MKKIVVYIKGYCPYCRRATSLLKKVGADFEEIDVTNDQETYSKVKEKSGCQTVPQIFVGDKFIGGYDDLYALKVSGKLEEQLEV